MEFKPSLIMKVNCDEPNIEGKKIKSKKKRFIKTTQVNLDWWSVQQRGPREF